MCTCAWSNTNCNSNISKYYSENHFKYFFILFYRLAINYRVCDGGGQEKLEDIHQKCTLQFNNILTVPTKEVLSKLIQTIFHITSFLRYTGKSKYTAFKLVEKETPVEEIVSLKIPEHCSMNTTCNSSSIQIVVQTEFCINGKCTTVHII